MAMRDNIFVKKSYVLNHSRLNKLLKILSKNEMEGSIATEIFFHLFFCLCLFRVNLIVYLLKDLMPLNVWHILDELETSKILASIVFP